MADAGADEEPTERVDASTQIAKRLTAFVKAQLKRAEGSSAAVRGTYDSADSFETAVPGAQTAHEYLSHPALLQRMCTPVMRSGSITSEAPLDPLLWHLEGTKVYVFNPFFYKAAWACGDQVREQPVALCLL